MHTLVFVNDFLTFTYIAIKDDENIFINLKQCDPWTSRAEQVLLIYIYSLTWVKRYDIKSLRVSL